MTRRFALSAEVVRSCDDPAAEMVLPQAVHDHASHEVAGAVVYIGEPVGETSPSVQLRLDRPTFALPISGRSAVSHQYWQKILLGNLNFFLWIAALQDVSVRIE